MVLWLAVAGNAFASVFISMGGQAFISNILLGLEVNRWIIVVCMQLIWILLGCFLESIAIMLITIPIFVPVVGALGFPTLWFGVMFVVNMELGFLTPPFGMNLFYMKAVAPKGVKMMDIYRASIPFIAIQAGVLAICTAFPQIITFLPEKVFG
jgi:TRAP-type mannitol/chloroaromatic compound transport system permease large subunit